jgi:hypothetical protein
MSSKPLKKKKLPSLKKLCKAAHALWSLIVRHADKVCQVCGTSEKLQGHHCLVPKGKGGSVRFFIDNGIALCDICHIWTYHKGRGGITFDRKLLAAIDRKIPLARQEEIIKLAAPHRYKRDELTHWIYSLTETLDKLKEKP